MFKRDAKGRFVYTDVGFFKKKRQWRFESGKWKTVHPMDEETYQRILAAQQENPISVMQDPAARKRWWVFLGEFYWEDEGLSAGDVKVLALDRFMQDRKKVQRATVRLSASEGSGPTNREAIPDEIKVLVWQRDEGRCVRCKSQDNLEFDHIIPLVKGGSNTFRNIQLLCEKCNREKGGNLT